MTIKLEGIVATNTSSHPFDVLQIKQILNKLGYYKPYGKTGITPIPDKEMFQALKHYQRNHGIESTGEIRPNDKTVLSLNDKEQNIQSEYYIWRTAEDKNVRGEHAKLNGTKRKWTDHPHPGEEHNCRCWAEPVHNILPNTPDHEVKDAIIQEEEDIDYMYLDPKGYVTVGVGFMLPDVKTAQQLPFTWEEKRPATADEIKNAYNRVKNSTLEPNTKASAFNPKYNTRFLPVYLGDNVTEQKLEERLKKDVKDLRKKFPDFDTYPPDVQQALLDMNFNLGNTGFSKERWPNLFDAIEKQEWDRAAEESHRKDIGRKRNQQIHDWLKSGSKKQKNNQQ